MSTSWPLPDRLFPLVGFEGERYFANHYLVNFGEVGCHVTWNLKRSAYFVGAWGGAAAFVRQDERVWVVSSELDALAILHHIRDTFGGN